MKYRYLLFILLLTACQSEQLVCSDTELNLGTSCCLDEDQNQICDEFEYVPPPIELVQERTTTVDHDQYITLEELQGAIVAEYYPTSRRMFFEVDRSGATGFDRKYNVSHLNEEFYIYKINSEDDFLYTEREFIDFISKAYQVEIKNTELYSREIVDYVSLFDQSFKAATHQYEYSLDTQEFNGVTAFSEVHSLFFIRGDAIIEYVYSDELIVQCTPELYVSVTFPLDNFKLEYHSTSVIVMEEALDKLVKTNNAQREQKLAKVLEFCQS